MYRDMSQNFVQNTAHNIALDDFIFEYERAPFEFVNGARVSVIPDVALREWILQTLVSLLSDHCTTHKAGQVLQKLHFAEHYGDCPDLMFFARTNWMPSMIGKKSQQKKPLMILPDLAVEVTSPYHEFSDVEEKAAEYLAQGIRMVWMIDPQNKRVCVYEGDRRILLTQHDTLTGGEVLPGLKIQLRELFA